MYYQISSSCLQLVLPNGITAEVDGMAITKPIGGKNDEYLANHCTRAFQHVGKTKIIL